METSKPFILTPLTPGKRGFNFSAGPAVLPLSVLEEAQKEMLLYGGAGASILEISHRSPEYTAIAESAKALLRKHLGMTNDWHIMFLQGGASLQFHQVPLNCLPTGVSADYIETGSWAVKALKEAQFLGNARSAASSKASNFNYIPPRSTWDLDPKAAYVHITSNNTIFGTQFHEDPAVDVPLVCDASSDFLSRKIDIDRYALIYAGAQKNIGPAGTTVVLIRDDLLQRRNKALATMLDYGTHAAKLFNTPSVFAVYFVEKVLRWLDGLGGVEAMERLNETKAASLYERIDRGDFYRGTAERSSRSRMNVTFRLATEELEQLFVAEAKSYGLLGLKGHRSAGGIRASIYNACPTEAVAALIAFMDYFEDRNS